MVGATAPASRAGVVALGLAADRLFGEPPGPIHPVARFGSAMERLERRLWADRRDAGCIFALIGVGGAVVAGVGCRRLVGGATALGLAVASCSASRALLDAGGQVASALASSDLDAARAALPALVGRDVAELEEKEIARAVVESLAENLSDAVVGTALWGLVAGAPGALGHRAANTLDAMVGHRSARYARFGWAAARLDDALGWPAARLSALLIAVATPRRAGEIWRIWHAEAGAHPSPNAGVVEGAFAAALDLALGGTNHYGGRAEVRPNLGDGRPPEAADIARALGLVRRVVSLLELVLVSLWALSVRVGRRRGSRR